MTHPAQEALPMYIQMECVAPLTLSAHIMETVEDGNFESLRFRPSYTMHFRHENGSHGNETVSNVYTMSIVDFDAIRFNTRAYSLGLNPDNLTADETQKVYAALETTKDLDSNSVKLSNFYDVAIDKEGLIEVIDRNQVLDVEAMK